MVTGFASIFINLFYLLGILIILILITGMIGVLKDSIKALFVKGKMSKIIRKLIKIEKYANETLRDFNNGARFMGLAKSEKLGEELCELEELCDDIEKENKKKKA